MTIYTTIVPIRPDCTEAPAPTEIDLGALSGSVTLSADTPYKRRATVTAAVSFTLATPTGTAPTLRLRLVNSADGVTLAFAGVRWVGGAVPEWATTAGAENVVVLDYGASGWVGDGGAL